METIKKIFSDKNIRILSVIFLLFLIGWLSFGKYQKIDVEFIVLEKNAGTSLNLDQAVENIINLPLDSSENITLKRKGESSIIRLSTYSRPEENAVQNTETAIRDVFTQVSHYYNIKNQIQLRIVSFGYPRYVVRFDSLANIIILLGIILIVGLLFLFIQKTQSFWKKIEIKKIIPKKKFPSFPKKNFFPKKKVSKKENKPKEKKKKEKAENPFIQKTTQKNGFAPKNLPLAGDEIEKLFGKNINEPKNNTEEEKSTIKEATPEEVKERLNKLLSGL